MTINEDIDDGIPFGGEARNFSSSPYSQNGDLGIINYGSSNPSVVFSELNEQERAERIANNLSNFSLWIYCVHFYLVCSFHFLLKKRGIC